MSKSKRKLKRIPSPGLTSAQNETSQDNPADEARWSNEDLHKPSSDEDVDMQLPQDADRKAKVQNPNHNQEEPSLLAKLVGAKRPPEYQYGYIDPEQPHEYKRSGWKHFIRYPMSWILLLLNVAIVMSFLDRLPRHRTIDPVQELFFFGVVAFIDVFLFIPIVFEVNRVRTDAAGLSLSTLYWKVRLRWDQLASFEQPRFLKFTILRTKKTFYLLNKYDLKPYFELAEIISAKMPAPIEDREA